MKRTKVMKLCTCTQCVYCGRNMDRSLVCRNPDAPNGLKVNYDIPERCPLEDWVENTKSEEE